MCPWSAQKSRAYEKSGNPSVLIMKMRVPLREGPHGLTRSANGLALLRLPHLQIVVIVVFVRRHRFLATFLPDA
jgi:hypothetical protein